MTTLFNEIRFATRYLSKGPGFTIAALLTLTLCIGANLTIFSVVDTVLLRPLPFPQAERLVTIYNNYPGSDLGRSQSSYTNLYTRRGNIEAFSSISGYRQSAVNVEESGSIQRREILRISAEFFDTLDTPMALGRSFVEDEMTFQTHHVTILTYNYWRRQFKGDPNILGANVKVNGFNKTVIGVLSPGFRFLSAQPQLFLPLTSSSGRRGMGSLHNSTDLHMIARLKPGATIRQAQSQIDAHNVMLAPNFPYANALEGMGFHSVVAPLQADHVAGIRPTLVLLQVGSLCLFLIGAVNLSNLLLVRANARAREFAIRRSLGANTWQLSRQIFTEIMFLSVLGGLGGLAVGWLGIRLLPVFGVDQLPMGMHVSFDRRIALAGLLGALAAGVVLALPVLWLSLRRQIATVLGSGSRGVTVGQASQRLRHGFVATQMALSFILLAGTGLLTVSLKRTMAISPGFKMEQTMTGHISAVHNRYLANTAHTDRADFANRVVTELGALPGVSASGITTSLPLHVVAKDVEQRAMTPVGSLSLSGEGLPTAIPYVHGIAGDYFQAIGVSLQAGRLFDETATPRDANTCIVDEAFANRHWAGTNPIGRRIYNGPTIDDNMVPFTVVGVVSSVKHAKLTEKDSGGTIYLPLRRHVLKLDNLYVVVRTGQKPESIGPIMQKIIRDIDPDLPLHDLKTMETRLSNSLITQRSPMFLAGIFSVLALLLVAIGTYGVISYTVSQRRREIGVRIAMGALRTQIGRQFSAIGLRMFLLGAVPGILGTWIAGHTMQSLLYDVPPFHLATVSGTMLLLGAVTLAACVIPASRASRVDPVVALRAE